MKKTKKKVFKKSPKVRTEKDFIAYISKKIEEWKSILLLERCEFSIEKKKRQSDSYMEINVNYPYLNPTLYYSSQSLEDFIEKSDDAFIEQVIIHEMCHCITEPLYDKSIRRFVSVEEMKDERELLTDLITNILWKQKKFTTK
jgi:hypothetical protein